MKALLRPIYKLVQRALGVLGLVFVLSPVTVRNKPEVINRAIWKPFVIDDYWRSLYKSTQALTKGDGTDNIYRQCRFYSTFQMAKYAAQLPVGDVVECGCWHGHSTLAIASILSEQGFTGAFHVFDSFEGGLSSFTEKDESFFRLSDEEKNRLIKVFGSSYDFVKSITTRFTFVELHKGWIPQIFDSFLRRPIKLLHVDVDMYEPTKASLDYFWGSVVPGGCVVVDDYNHTVFEGATKAVDEFVSDKTPRLFYRVPFGGSCFIIK